MIISGGLPSFISGNPPKSRFAITSAAPNSSVALQTSRARSVWQDSQIQIIDEDLGRSGSTSKRRTGWQRLQTMIAAKQVGAVFVATISRLSRQVLDFELFRMLAALHNTLLYTDGHLVNLADSNDTVVSQITAIVAQFENRKNYWPK